MPNKLIEPADFLAVDTPMPQRPFGIENEYLLQNFDKDGREIPLYSYIGDAALKAAGVRNHGYFLDFGAKLYIDMNHLEFATVECLGPEAAAEKDIAGIFFMQKLLAAAGLPHRGLFGLAGTSMTKQDGETIHKTSGTHENSQFPRQLTNTDALRKLIPGFLATRLYGWSGAVRDNFVFSQKVWGIGGDPIAQTLERRTGHGNKPMVIIPPVSSDNDVIGNPKWARLENRIADPVRFARARFLSLATTSLVQRMIEHPELLDPEIYDYVDLVDPVGAARLFASDLTLTQTVPTKSGKEVTLRNVQEVLAKNASRINERIKLPADEVKAIALWHDFNQKLALANPAKAEYGRLTTEYDFAALHIFLANDKSVGLDNIHQANVKAVTRFLGWHSISPAGGAERFSEQYPDPTYLDAEKARREMNISPDNTRGAIRSKIIGDRTSPYKVDNWSTINRQGKTTKLDTYQTELAT